MPDLSLFLILGIAVLVHEFGHFFAARLSGVRVYELSLFFSPGFSLVKYDPCANFLYLINRPHPVLSIRLGRPYEDCLPTSWRRTVYTLGWLPFGGFCRVADQYLALGEIPKYYTLAAKSPITRILFYLAGVTSNFITAIIALSSIYFFWPVQSVDIRPMEECESCLVAIGDDLPDGINVGDTIVSIDGKRITKEDELEHWLSTSPEPMLTYVDTLGSKFEIPLICGTQIAVKSVYKSPNIQIHNHDIGFALKTGIKQSVDALVVIMRHPIILISSAETSWLDETFPAVRFIEGDFSEVQWLLFIFGLLSLFIMMFNLLPIPGLDGSRIYLPLYELITRRRASDRLRNMLDKIGSYVILVLFVWFVVSIFV